MTASHTMLAHVSDLVRVELAGYIPDAFAIAGVTSERLSGPDVGDYIRTTVIFEDDHPELDARALNKFSTHLDPLCNVRGFDGPSPTQMEARYRHDFRHRAVAPSTASYQLDRTHSRWACKPRSPAPSPQPLNLRQRR